MPTAELATPAPRALAVPVAVRLRAAAVAEDDTAEEEAEAADNRRGPRRGRLERAAASASALASDPTTDASPAPEAEGEPSAAPRVPVRAATAAAAAAADAGGGESGPPVVVPPAALGPEPARVAALEAAAGDDPGKEKYVLMAKPREVRAAGVKPVAAPIAAGDACVDADAEEPTAAAGVAAALAWEEVDAVKLTDVGRSDVVSGPPEGTAAGDREGTCGNDAECCHDDAWVACIEQELETSKDW
jgi:hypothetical protein